MNGILSRIQGQKPSKPSPDNNCKSREKQLVKGILSDKERVRDFFDSPRTSILVPIQDKDIMNQLSSLECFDDRMFGKKLLRFMNRNSSSTVIWVTIASERDSDDITVRLNNLEVTKVTNDTIEDFARSFSFNHTIFDPLAEDNNEPTLIAYP